MTRIDQIKQRLEATTPGNWVYLPDRDTHDFCIAAEGYTITGYNNVDDAHGVVGSSEWIWLGKDNAQFIANAKSDIAYLLSLLPADLVLEQVHQEI